MIDSQFYPTPPALIQFMYSMFHNKPGHKARVLEPSAGRGDLVQGLLQEARRYAKINVDCIESDMQNVAILRAMNLNVICYDFLSFKPTKLYSHIIMNPPFAEGAKHVLKAWQVLQDGEIVAVINRKTLDNPCDKYRVLLKNIINDTGGRVEYLDSMFLSPDTQRKTSVEVAVIHLKKSGTGGGLDWLEDLTRDEEPDDERLESYGKADKELLLPGNTVENLVTAFYRAIFSLRKSTFVSHQMHTETMKHLSFFKGIFSEDTNLHFTRYAPQDIHEVRESYNTACDELRRIAWNAVLDETRVGKSLSTVCYERVKNDFEKICQLEFSVANIHSFLSKLASEKNNLLMESLASVFDYFTEYGTGNRIYYAGWKSNDRHKTLGYKLKYTRFIFPYYMQYSSVSTTTLRRLQDIDNCFALLDEKTSENTLLNLVNKKYRDLETSDRFQTEYFDIRVYPGAQTMHLFPCRKDLIDKLNLIVGRYRNWIPNADTGNKDFWQQYKKAEAVNEKMKVSQDGADYFIDNLQNRKLNEEKLNAVLQVYEQYAGAIGIKTSFPAIGFQEEETEPDSIICLPAL